MYMSKLIFSISLTLLSVVPALAQSASVRGVVLDPSDVPAAGVTVGITNEATGGSRRGVTGTDGYFTVATLPPGAYLIEVAQAGYKTYVSRTELQTNQELWIEVSLELGNVSEEVLVTAPLVPIEKESAALRTVIDNRLIAGLPLDGRNFLELSLLAPGVAPAPEGSASSLRGDFAFTVNGAREDFNSFLLDGVYNVDPKLNTLGVRPPVDAIKEFEVVTSLSDASFGRNAAGQINVVTQSGTNLFHGTAYGVLPKWRSGRSQFLCAGRRARAGLQQSAIRWFRRRPDRARPDVLFRRLRTHTPPRGNHARHPRSDARRTQW